jgi:hypothetical protein
MGCACPVVMMFADVDISALCTVILCSVPMMPVVVHSGVHNSGCYW